MMSLEGYLTASPHQVRASRGASRGPTEQAERHGEREPRSKLSAVVSASLEIAAAPTGVATVSN